MSTHHWFRASFGVLAIAAFVPIGSVTAIADFDHFRLVDRAVAATEVGARRCWQWNAMDGSAPVCRAGTYRNDTIVDPPPEDRAPIHYDYPSYGPGVSGSSLSFVVGTHRRDDLRPPPHAE